MRTLGWEHFPDLPNTFFSVPLPIFPTETTLTLELKGKTRTILESISRDRRAAIRAVKGRVRINCNTMFPLLRDVLLPLAHVHICVKIGHQKVISRRGEGREERDRITFPLCELSPRDRGTLCSTNFSPSRALMKRSFGSKR